MDKQHFIESCKDLIKLETEKKITIQDASNQICELCNKNFDTLIVNDAELKKIMDITCDLELPTEHRERPLEDWGVFKNVIINRLQ